MRAAGERKYQHAPFQKHSETSRSAAESIKPQLNRLEALVYAAFEQYGSLTDEDLVDVTRLSPSTARPRRIRLVELGLIEDSGNTKHTRSGRSATIWRVK